MGQIAGFEWVFWNLAEKRPFKLADISRLPQVSGIYFTYLSPNYAGAKYLSTTPDGVVWR